MRISGLQSTLTDLKKQDHADFAYIQFIERDIQRSTAVMDVFTKAMLDDGSLYDEPAEASTERITSAVEARVPSILSVYCLATLTSQEGDRGTIENAKAAVQELLTREIKSRFGIDGDAMARDIILQDIDAIQWKRIGREHFIGRLILSYDEILQILKQRVIGALETEMHENTHCMTGRMVTRTIAEQTMSLLRHGFASHLTHDIDALELSWTWKKIRSRILRDFTIYQDIISSFGNDLSIDPMKSRFYHRNPLVLEKDLFAIIRKRYQFTPAAINIAVPSPGINQVVLIIPYQTDNLCILEDLDQLRKKGVQALNGRENDEFFRQLHNQADSLVRSHTRVTVKIFSHEQGKIIRLRDPINTPHMEIVNLPEFEKALSSHQHKLKASKDYEKATIDFITWLSSSMRITGGSSLQDHLVQMNPAKRQLDFIIDLSRESVDTSDIESREIVSAQARSSRRIAGLFNYMESTIGLNDREKSTLTTHDLRTVAESNGEFLKQLSQCRHQVADNIQRYSLACAHHSAHSSRAAAYLRERIAQNEIDVLWKNAEEYADLYETYKYTDTIFTLFTQRYNDLLNLSNARKLTHDLSRVIDTQSVLEGLSDFSHERLRNEIALKQTIRAETRNAIAGVMAMLEFYRRRKIAIQCCPDPCEISLIKKKVERQAVAIVSELEMNELNFAEADAKAAMYLKRTINYRLWRKDPSSDGSPEDTDSYSFATDSSIIKIKIPRGWREARNDFGQGIIKSFRSLDTLSQISLAQVPAGGRTNRDVAISWLKNIDSSRAKMRWGKTLGIEYYWVLSRDKDRQVRETYAFTKNGSVFIISGTTDALRYPLFNKKLQAVVDSVSY